MKLSCLSYHFFLFVTRCIHRQGVYTKHFPIYSILINYYIYHISTNDVMMIILVTSLNTYMDGKAGWPSP